MYWPARQHESLNVEAVYRFHPRFRENATLYASGNLTAQLTKTGLFPEIFGETSRLGRHAGLLITTGLVLLVANLVDLSAIASVGSAVSLMVFLLVGIAGWRRRADTNSNPVIVALALGVIAIVLGFFAVDTIQTAPWTFVAIVVLGLLAIVLDAVGREAAISTETTGRRGTQWPGETISRSRGRALEPGSEAPSRSLTSARCRSAANWRRRVRVASIAAQESAHGAQNREHDHADGCG